MPANGWPASRQRFCAAAGTLVWSIVPIALAYHFSHYLTALLVNGQYALVALSDPFSLGWNLFGTAHMQVERGDRDGLGRGLGDLERQAAAIVGGHVRGGAGRAPAGLPAARNGRARAALSQLPLTVLMIAYTVFGLWLLSTPTAA